MGGFQISDELLGIFVPILVYWVYSGIYTVLGYFESYRFHTKQEEDEKNLISKGTVVRGVLLLQVIQAIVVILLYTVTGNDAESGTGQQKISFIVLARQFITAMLVMDTYLYFMHRYLHHNKFLYRHLHSQHHRLVAPYAYGAVYNHPLEYLMVDTAGGALAVLLSGMSPRTSIFFFSLATIKAVDDHCGLWLSWNFFNMFFQNNTAYHYVHHQLYGNKYNFSTLFFVIWDKILGTYMPCSVEKRAGGGFEVRPVKECKED